GRGGRDRGAIEPAGTHVPAGLVQGGPPAGRDLVLLQRVPERRDRAVPAEPGRDCDGRYHAGPDHQQPVQHGLRRRGDRVPGEFQWLTIGSRARSGLTRREKSMAGWATAWRTTPAPSPRPLRTRWRPARPWSYPAGASGTWRTGWT